jgi:hypothetical protein
MFKKVFRISKGASLIFWSYGNYPVYIVDVEDVKLVKYGWLKSMRRVRLERLVN